MGEFSAGTEGLEKKKRDEGGREIYLTYGRLGVL